MARQGRPAMAPVEGMMIIGAAMIVIVSLSHAREFVRTGRPRYLVAAIVTLPAAAFLFAIAFRCLG